MEDTVHRWKEGVGELPYSTETKLTTLSSGEDVSGKAIRQWAPPGSAWSRKWLDEVGWGVIARTSRKPLSGTREGADLSSAER